MLLLLLFAAALGAPSQAVAFRTASDSGTVICILDVCHMSDPAVHGSSDLPVVFVCADALSRSLASEQPLSPEEPLRRFLMAFLKDRPPERAGKGLRLPNLTITFLESSRTL
jgi:hypothetical protein